MEERRNPDYYRRVEDALLEHLNQESNRLDRIEEKLDKLTDTVVALARAEEKLVNLEKSRQEIADTLDIHEERLDKLDDRVSSTELATNVLSKIFWIAVAAGSTFIVTQLAKTVV